MTTQEHAVELAKRGKATGPVCKVLSGVAMLIMPVVLSAFLHDRLWIPAGFLAILWFANGNYWFSLIALAWAIAVQAWLPTAVLGALLCVVLPCPFIGVAHARKVVEQGRASLGPFFGIPLAGAWSVVTGLLLAFLPWLPGAWMAVAGVPAGVLLLLGISRTWFRLWPRWHRLHYPMMFVYAAAAAYHVNRAEALGTSADMRECLHDVLSETYAGDVVDESVLLEMLDEAYATVAPFCLDAEHGHGAPVRNYLLVRAVVRAAVRRDYGEAEADRYWLWVLCAVQARFLGIGNSQGDPDSAT